MISERWLCGWGAGGFEAHYMDYQAEYFKCHPEANAISMLADNVQYPFSEYLYIMTNFGVAGLAVSLRGHWRSDPCFTSHHAESKPTCVYALWP